MTIKKKIKKQGIVQIIPERCKDCGFCIWICPNNALSRSEEANGNGYHYPILTGQCSGCRKCEQICPDFAIFIEDLPKPHYHQLKN